MRAAETTAIRAETIHPIATGRSRLTESPPDSAIQSEKRACSSPTAREGEIKNLVVTNLNNYFEIDKWDFGQTFYFSELAAYIHRNMGGIVSSVVLVPLDPLKSFGDLYEIRSGPSQIFVNGAGVNSVEVITALTSTNIKTAAGSGVI